MSFIPPVHSGNRHSRVCGGRGYTLVELIIVIGIIAAVMGLTAAGVTSMIKSYRISRTLTGIEKILEIGREEAVTRRTYVWVGVKADTLPVLIGALASLNGDPSNTAESNLRRLTRVLQLSNADIQSFSVAPNPGAASADMVSVPLVIGRAKSYSTCSFVFTPQGQVVVAKTITPSTPSVDEVALNLTFQKGVQAQIRVKGGNGEITDNWQTR